MHFGELIDRVIETYLNVGGDDATLKALRQRLVVMGQELAQEVWSRYPWSFKLADATITVAGGAGAAVLPVNFADFGPRSGAWIGRNELTYRQQQLFAADRIMGQGGTISQVFTMKGFDPTTKRPLIQVWPSVADGTNIVLTNYQVNTPNLVDHPPEPGVTVEQVADPSAITLYRYAATFVNPDGGETDMGLISDSIFAEIGTDIVVVSFEDGFNPLHLPIKLYRSLDSGPFLFLDDVDPFASIYEDLIPDPLPAVPVPTDVNTGLEVFPLDWHANLFHKGLRWAAMEGVNDGRAIVQEAEFQRRLTQAWANHSPEANRGFVLPSHVAYRPTWYRG